MYYWYRIKLFPLLFFIIFVIVIIIGCDVDRSATPITSETVPISGAQTAISLQTTENHQALIMALSTSFLWSITENINTSTITIGEESKNSNPIIMGTNLNVNNGSEVYVYNYIDDPTCSNIIGHGIVLSSAITIDNIHFSYDGSNDGEKVFYVRVVNSANDASTCIATGLSYTLDTASPATPDYWTLASPTKGATSNDYTPEIVSSTVTGSHEGDYVYIYDSASCDSLDADAEVDAIGTATIQNRLFIVSNIVYPQDGSLDGNKHFYAFVIDVLGNKTECLDLDLYYSLDTLSPGPENFASAILSSPSASTTSNDSTPRITEGGIVGEERSVVSIYNSSSCSTSTIGSATIISGSFTVSDITYLNNGADDGAKSFFGIITDLAGNSSSCTSFNLGYLLDTVAPSVTITSPSVGFAFDSSTMAGVAVSGSCSENSRDVTLTVTDGGTESASCTSGSYVAALDLSSMPSGTVTVTATHSDAAGNSAPSPLATNSVSLFKMTMSITRVSSGIYHTCALLNNGGATSVKCFGYNTSGGLGQGHTNRIGDGPSELGENLSPINFGVGLTPYSIATGNNHSCVLLNNDAGVKCFGSNSSGELGLGHTYKLGDNAGEMGDNLSIINFGAGLIAADISAGGEASCSILNGGYLKCWGYNSYGGLGQGNTSRKGYLPNQMGDNLSTINLGTGRTALAVKNGTYHTCVLLDNHQIKCFGSNSNGQLGQGHINSLGDGADEMGVNLTTVNLGVGRSATSLATGANYTCVLFASSGEVKCFGSNVAGGLGQGHTNVLGDNSDEMGDNLSVILLGAGRTATAIVAGTSFTCALLDDSTVKCFGLNLYGQLGQGHTLNLGDNAGEMGANLSTIKVGTGRSVTAIVAGQYHVCVILDDTSLKCFGYNAYGQIGIGNNVRFPGDGAGEMGDNLSRVAL